MEEELNLEKMWIELLEENARLKHRIWLVELRVANLENIIHSRIFLNQNKISERLIELFGKGDYEELDEYINEVLKLETQITENGKTIEDLEEIIRVKGVKSIYEDWNFPL